MSASEDLGRAVELMRALLLERDAAVAMAGELRVTARETIREGQEIVVRSRALAKESRAARAGRTYRRSRLKL